MGNLAAASANQMLQAYVGNATFTANAGFFVKLHLGDPGSAGANNAAANTTRQAATMGTASGGATSNTAAIEWTNVPNTEVYTHVSLWTASTGGTFLGSDQLSSSASVTAGDTFRIPVGDLDVTITTVV